MKTPMQEMLEWVRATLPMDLDTSRMIEEKVKSLIPKEKEVIENAFLEGRILRPLDSEQWYNETFNTKER